MVSKKRIRKTRPDYVASKLTRTGSKPVVNLRFGRVGDGYVEEVNVTPDVYQLKEMAKTIQDALVSIRESQASDWRVTDNTIKALFAEAKK